MTTVKNGQLDQIKQTTQDLTWILANKETLRKSYPNQTVCVIQGQVVAFGKDMEEIQQNFSSLDLTAAATHFIAVQTEEAIP